jgi:multimeric flavodoxin WrbA
MKTILMIAGSRNQAGQTARAADAVLTGVAQAECGSDRIFLPLLRLDRCRQCEDNGWGLCRREGRCVIEDDFAGLVGKIRVASAVVVATPVYYSDLSESLRAFLDRLRRICTHETGRAGIAGKPALGVCVAGGGGGGAPACCMSLEKVLGTCGFAVTDMIPVRRQNLEAKLEALRFAGKSLAAAMKG